MDLTSDRSHPPPVKPALVLAQKITAIYTKLVVLASAPENREKPVYQSIRNAYQKETAAGVPVLGFPPSRYIPLGGRRRQRRHLLPTSLGVLSEVGRGKGEAQKSHRDC